MHAMTVDVSIDSDGDDSALTEYGSDEFTEIETLMHPVHARMRERQEAQYIAKQRMSTFDVGELITLLIPKQFRAKLDMLRVFCIVWRGQHKHHYHLQCRFGHIKEIFSANVLNPLTGVTAAECGLVAETTETISLRSVARKLSIPSQTQRLILCDCGTACATRRCPCRLYDLTCSSNCHDRPGVSEFCTNHLSLVLIPGSKAAGSAAAPGQQLRTTSSPLVNVFLPRITRRRAREQLQSGA